MKIHFISIGGAVMHNLAIALKERGYKVTGSDDEIFEPSLSRLKKHKILPEKIGWFPKKITKELDAVILGMHAREDNPELIKAREEGIKIYSFPEFLYEKSKNKKRIVIAGSHGKTTVTSMVMKVLKDNNVKFDYMVGAKIDGFDTMVGFSDDSELAIFEGDEYLTSALDKKPKFLWYKPHATVITGIAWDHANVFPDKEIYLEQFEDYVKSIAKGGKLYYFEGDEELKELVKNNNSISSIPYKEQNYEIENEHLIIKTRSGNHKMNVFGRHNAQNVEAARLICSDIGIRDEDFYESIKNFKGAQRRLQLVYAKNNIHVYYDFAHAPSKVKATTDAVREKHPGSKIISCLELHTFSSLNKDFLPQYKGKTNSSDKTFVYFNPDVVKHKKLPEIGKDYVSKCFGNSPLVFNDSDELFNELKNHINNDETVLLIMTSGSFDGKDIMTEIEKIIE